MLFVIIRCKRVMGLFQPPTLSYTLAMKVYEAFFMNESPLTVPIQPKSDATKKVNPICCVQINGSEITLSSGGMLKNSD